MKFRRDDSMLRTFADFPVDRGDIQLHCQLPKAMRTAKTMQTRVHDDVTAYCDDSTRCDDWMASNCDGCYWLDYCYCCYLNQNCCCYCCCNWWCFGADLSMMLSIYYCCYCCEMNSRCLSQQEVYLHTRKKNVKFSCLFWLSSHVCYAPLLVKKSVRWFGKIDVVILPLSYKFILMRYDEKGRKQKTRASNKQHVWYFMTVPSDFYKVPMNYAISAVSQWMKKKLLENLWKKIVHIFHFRPSS